jgi:arylsulfatase A-like enzyme
MTGLHPHQTGIGILTYDSGPEGYAGNLNHRCVTIPQVLKAAGYRTYMSGKWHVASSLTKPTDAWPMQRGFDAFYGTIIGAGSFYDPNTLTRGNENIEHEARTPGFFYTDAISDNACAFVEQHCSGEHADKPFFEYVAYTAPHWPLHAHDDDIARYRGRFDAGWDRLRQERLDKLVASGILQPHWKLTERDPTQPPWTEAEKDEQFRAWTLRCMEVYAAQIDRMDQGIGRLLATLEKHGKLADTLVIFAPDDAERRAGALRQRREAHARAGEHVPELRHGVGQPLEQPVPPLQALDPRRRHRDAADRALAERHREHGERRGAPCARLPARHDGDDRRRDRRDVSAKLRRAGGRSARRPVAAAGVRQGHERRRPQADVLGARGQRGGAHR